MSKNRAADNVTVNEQMMEVLSTAWKALPEMVGGDWETVKKALLADMAKVETMDDPDLDMMVGMVAHHFHDYPEAMAYLNSVNYKITGEWREEFNVTPPVVEAVIVEEPEVEAAVVEAIVVEAEAEAMEVEFGEAEAVEFEEEAAEVSREEDDDTNFYRVPVYFATNRKRDRRYKAHRSFTGSRSNDMHYGLAQVSMPKTHTPGTLEGPSRWRREKADPNRHILVLSVDMLDKTSFVSSANDALKDAESNEALVYIHGYNVSFGGALRITAQVATDLEFKGIPITYSWPSMAKTLRYNADEANIAHGQVFFDNFLTMIAKELNVTKIHILAHSMGNRLATQGIYNLDEQAAAGKLGQVIFASPDVDRGVFSQRAERFTGKADGYTLYINESDLALELSKLIHGYSRAGERDNDPLVVAPVETIDATNIDGSLLGHSFYQRDKTVLGDIMGLVLDNLKAAGRPNLLQKGTAKIYWEMTR